MRFTMPTIVKLKLAILFFLMSALIYAQPSGPSQLHQLATQFLNEHQQSEHISAVAITLKSPLHPHFISAYSGTVGTHQQIPLNEKNLFQVGSLTKSFISAILLILESDKQYHFSINDRITKFFPEYPKWHAITVKQLMNMTSGIPNYSDIDHFVRTFAAYPYLQHNKKTWVNVIYQRPLLFSPGSQYHYSNTNYLILGMLIEKLTGHTLAYEIKQRIIAPLHLTHTHFISHQPPSTITRFLVHGYQNETGYLDFIPQGTDVTAYSLSYMEAAGGIVSNTDDIAKWIQALFTPGKVLSATQFKKLTTMISQKTGQLIKQLSSNDALGFGLGIRKQYSEQLNSSYYIYQGMTLGYRVIYFYFPAKETIIVIAVNSSFDGKENHLIGLINQIGEKMLV